MYENYNGLDKADIVGVETPGKGRQLMIDLPLGMLPQDRTAQCRRLLGQAMRL